MLELTIVCCLLVGLVAFLLIDRRVERREWTTERADLIQRIQAPQAAVVAHQIASLPDPVQSLPFEDDDAFHETREQMADRLR